MVGDNKQTQQTALKKRYKFLASYFILKISRHIVASLKTLRSCITSWKFRCQKFCFFLSQLLKFLYNVSLTHKNCMLSFLKQYITIKNLQKYLSFPYTRQTFKNGWNLAYEGFVNKYVQSLLAIFALVFRSSQMGNKWY